MPDDADQTPARSDADKERSKSQSRPVGGGKTPPPAKSGTAKKAAPARAGSAGGAGRSGGGPRPPKGGAPRQPVPGPRRSPTTILTWGLVALVLLVVIVLVVVNVVSGNNGATAGEDYPLAGASLVQQVTQIPTSVYNQVGVSSSAAQVSPPAKVEGQPPLKFEGKPGVYYFGAEYCPYCAAERWALVTSMARFGKFTSLGLMKSSPTDVYANTNTFSFKTATLTSPYIAFKTTEYYSNKNPTGAGYTILQVPTAQEKAVILKYENNKYIPGVSQGSFPFVDIGNKYFIAGASFSPAVLGGLTWQQIGQDLNDPTNPVTQAILATSNYISAATCDTDGQVPASVCTSSGVKTAAKALASSSSSGSAGSSSEG